MLQPGDLATGTVPFGQRPALIVVDMSYGFTSADSPLGGHFEQELTAMLKLLTCFREKQWPIFFSTVVYHDEQAASVFRQHLPVLNMLAAGSHWVEIDARLAPQDGETIVEKTVPSAFFNTGLAEQLNAAQADAVVIGGLTTSGCVRATVVDALQYNFPVWVVPEACGERNLLAHDANLHDMAAKYAQVVPLAQALAQLNAMTSAHTRGA